MNAETIKRIVDDERVERLTAQYDGKSDATESARQQGDGQLI